MSEKTVEAIHFLRPGRDLTVVGPFLAALVAVAAAGSPFGEVFGLATPGPNGCLKEARDESK